MGIPLSRIQTQTILVDPPFRQDQELSDQNKQILQSVLSLNTILLSDTLGRVTSCTLFALPIITPGSAHCQLADVCAIWRSSSMRTSTSPNGTSSPVWFPEYYQHSNVVHRRGPSDPEMQKRLEDDLIWWPRRLTLELSVAASPVDHQRLYQSTLRLHQSYAR